MRICWASNDRTTRCRSRTLPIWWKRSPSLSNNHYVNLRLMNEPAILPTETWLDAATPQSLPSAQRLNNGSWSRAMAGPSAVTGQLLVANKSLPSFATPHHVGPAQTRPTAWFRALPAKSQIKPLPPKIVSPAGQIFAETARQSHSALPTTAILSTLLIRVPALRLTRISSTTATHEQARFRFASTL